MILDDEAIESPISNRLNFYYNIFYSVLIIGLWITIFFWLKMIGELDSMPILLLNRCSDLIIILTVLGMFASLLGLIEKFKLNNKILIVGLIGVIFGGWVIVGPIFTYFTT